MLSIWFPTRSLFQEHISVKVLPWLCNFLCCSFLHIKMSCSGVNLDLEKNESLGVKWWLKLSGKLLHAYQSAKQEVYSKHFLIFSHLKGEKKHSRRNQWYFCYVVLKCAVCSFETTTPLFFPEHFAFVKTWLFGGDVDQVWENTCLYCQPNSRINVQASQFPVFLWPSESW